MGARCRKNRQFPYMRQTPLVPDGSVAAEFKG